MEGLNFKDVVVSIRELCLIGVFVLFLATPKWINEKLEEAGFKSVNLGFAVWERTLEESKKEVEVVRQTTAATQEKLTQISGKLEQLTTNANLRNATVLRREVQQLKVQVDASSKDLDRSQLELKESLKNHNIILKDFKSAQKNP